MAPSPFSLMSARTAPSSMLFSSPTSSTFFLPSQDCLLRTSSSLRLRIFCGRQALELDTESDNPPTKVAVGTIRKKRKPRPSFLQQVQDKWSLKLDSKRDKFPWQLQEEEGEEHGQPDPQRRQQESEQVRSVSQHSQVVNFHSEDEYNPSPWVPGNKTQNPGLGSVGETSQDSAQEGENADRFIEFLEDSYVDEADSSGDKTAYSSTFAWIHDDGGVGDGIEVSSSVEKNTFDLGRTNDASLNGNTGAKYDFDEVNNGFVSQDGSRKILGSGSIELPWRMEQDGKRTKRSNTELAERVVPDHELKRLRNIALRMLERIKVGEAGITEALVESIHKKWKVDEVVKLKFEGPHSVNMKRTHEMLEVCVNFLDCLI